MEMRVENPGVLGAWLTVRGINPSLAAPLVSLLPTLVPNGMYGYSPALTQWVPFLLSSSGAIIEFNSAAILTALQNVVDEVDTSNDLLTGVRADLGVLTAVVAARPTEFPGEAAALGNIAENTDTVNDSLAGVRSDLSVLTAAVGNQDREITGDVVNSAGRKFVGIDAGAYIITGVTTITFTGVNLLGRTPFVYDVTTGQERRITSIVDPAGATVGTITLLDPLRATTDTILIPFQTLPHAYEMLTDANRVRRIDPEWAHYVAPVNFLSQAIVEANGTVADIDIPVLDYGRFGFTIVWTGASVIRNYSWDIFGKINTTAYPATIAPFNINSWFQLTSGSSALGTAALQGWIVARCQDPLPFSEIRVRRTVAGVDAGNATTLDCWYTLMNGVR